MFNGAVRDVAVAEMWAVRVTSRGGVGDPQ